MRIAVLIIGVAFACLIFFQSCTFSYGESEGSADSEAGGVLFVVAVGMLIGAGFVKPFPLASGVTFALTGLIALAGATTTTADDQWIWMVIAFILAVMSFVGWRGKKHEDAQHARDRAVTQRAMTVLAAQGQSVICPRCGTSAPVSVRFCPNCGLERFPSTQATP
jgi:hypothetical protein